MAQCPEYKEEAATIRFYKAIGAHKNGQTGDIQDFKVSVYRWIQQRIRAWYRDLSPKGHNYSSQYWDEIQIEALITVPAMWSQLQCSVNINAARDAGLLNCQPRLEPLCAAALEMRLLRERNYLTDSKTVCWLDIGHATIDFALVRIEQPAVSGEEPKLVIVGKPCGALLGSHKIHDLAWDCIKSCDEVKQRGNLKACLNLLGNMSEAEFVRQAMDTIEYQKKQYPCRQFTITIYATEGW